MNKVGNPVLKILDSKTGTGLKCDTGSVVEIVIKRDLNIIFP